MKSWRSSSERLKAAKRSAREDDMLSPIVEHQHTESLFDSSMTENVGTDNEDSDKDDLWVTGVCILTVSSTKTESNRNRNRILRVSTVLLQSRGGSSDLTQSTVRTTYFPVCPARHNAKTFKKSSRPKRPTRQPYSGLATFATHPPLRHASNGRPESARRAPRVRRYLGALLGVDLGAV